MKQLVGVCPEGGAERVDDQVSAAGFAVHQALPTAQGTSYVDRQSGFPVRQESTEIQARAAGVRELRVNTKLPTH